MNWLRRWVIKWAMNGASIGGQTLAVSGKEESPGDSVRFQLTPAIGGRILRVTHDSHNPVTGYNTNSQTYIIASGEDVGARVAKIINLESLK